MWEAIGETGLACEQPWPKADAALLTEETVTLAIQVNGKLRDTLEAAKNAEVKAIEAQALQSSKVQPFIEGKTIRKVIMVPGKIVNIVAA